MYTKAPTRKAGCGGTGDRRSSSPWSPPFPAKSHGSDSESSTGKDSELRIANLGGSKNKSSSRKNMERVGLIQENAPELKICNFS
jgi:hypothetical protein